MKSARSLMSVVVVILAGSMNAVADLTLYVPDLTPVLRGSGFQSYPLAIDSKGDIFTVTGTSPSDKLLEITTSGQVLTINAAVGVDIGTNGKLDFGFGGNLYATSYGGVVQFSPSSGSSSMFYSNGSASGDAGMVFDPTRQILWVSGVGDNTIGLNSSGNVVETIHSFGGYGLALNSAGNLIAMGGTGIIEIANPNTLAITQVADLSSVLPNANIRSLAIDPKDGDLCFTNQFTGPNGSVGALDGLYRLNPDGTNLTLIANGFTGQEAFGASSAGNGATSIYLGDPNNYQLFEVQSVPEPSSLVIGATGALVLIGYSCWRHFRVSM
jgi:hypothetical protein